MHYYRHTHQIIIPLSGVFRKSKGLQPLRSRKWKQQETSNLLLALLLPLLLMKTAKPGSTSVEFITSVNYIIIVSMTRNLFCALLIVNITHFGVQLAIYTGLLGYLELNPVVVLCI